MADEPINVDRVLETASSLDAARMTLRWSLERVRYLESCQAETLDLLRQTQQARDQAVQALESARQSLDQRTQSINQKERFVTELERMLKSVFNGEIDARELVAHKLELERVRADLDAESRNLSQQAEERYKRQIEEQTRRIAEIESAHAKALTEAQTRYETQLKDLERQRQEDALLQSQKESRFREDLVEQLQKQSDQYHQKIVLMQLEYASKREELQKEFDRLKDRLFEESRQIESRQGFAVRVAQARWNQERQSLEAQLQARDERIAQLEKALEIRRQEEAERDAARVREVEQLRQEHEQQAKELREAHGRELLAIARTPIDRELEEAHKLERELVELRERHRADMATLQQRFLGETEALQAERRRMVEEYETQLAARTQEHRSLERDWLAQKESALRELDQRYQQQETLRAREAERQVQIAEVRHRQEMQSLREEIRTLRHDLDGIEDENHRLQAEHDRRLAQKEKEAAERQKAQDEAHEQALQDARAEQEKLRQALQSAAFEKVELERQREAAVEIARENRKAARRRWWVWLAAAAAAASVCLFAFAKAQNPLGRDYTVPFSHPSALSWSADDLWVSDWHEQAVFHLRQGDGGLELVRRHSTPNTRITALAVEGQSVYAVDAWTRQIQRRKQDDSLTVEKFWTSPGPNPSGLWFDGTRLWSSDLETRKIYQHALDENLTVLASYPLPYPPVGGFAKDRNFWSVDAQSQFIYKHNPPPDFGILGIFQTPEAREGRLAMSCFTWRNNHLWIGQDGVNQLIERPQWRLRKQ